MFSTFEFLLLLTIISEGILTIGILIRLFLTKKEIKKLKNIPLEKSDFKYNTSSLDFLDRLIENKYNFHMYTTLIPIYMDNKIPEKKVIHEIKEKIYVSVVGGLSQKTKLSILDFFTEKGIEMYIHERIMVLMNKTDFKTSGKYTEGFRDLKPNQMKNIMP
jgi:hypothetical protein